MHGNEETSNTGKMSTFWGILAEIAIVFSLDFVITAIGLVNQVSEMIIAIIISVLVMMLSVLVELLNMGPRKTSKIPVAPHKPLIKKSLIKNYC